MKEWHIETQDGTPMCVSAVEPDIVVTSRYSRMGVRLVCGHQSQEKAERAVEVLKTLGFDVKAVEGRCPAYESSWFQRDW